MNKTIKLENRVVVVEKLPLKKYSELLNAFQKLPQHINGLDKLNNEEILAKLPNILAESLPDLIGIFMVATDLKQEEIENLSLDEATDVFLAIIEVNQYKNVYDKIKKALGSQGTMKTMNKIGSGGQ